MWEVDEVWEAEKGLGGQRGVEAEKYVGGQRGGDAKEVWENEGVWEAH